MTAKAKAPAKPTEYVVLMRIVPLAGTKLTDVYPDEALDLAPLQDGSWVLVSTVVAFTKAKAITEAVGEREGTFKAVPLSSWRGGVTQAQTTMLKREALP